MNRRICLQKSEYALIVIVSPPGSALRLRLTRSVVRAQKCSTFQHSRLFQQDRKLVFHDSSLHVTDLDSIINKQKRIIISFSYNSLTRSIAIISVNMDEHSIQEYMGES